MVKEKDISKSATDIALERKRRKSRVGKIIAKAFIYLVLILMYAPLIYITVFAFTSATTTGVWTGFSFKTFTLLFTSNNKTSNAIWNAALNTVLVAVVSGLISTILGTFGAIGIFYSRNKWWKNSLEFVNQIPVVNAEIVTAVSLCILFVFVSRITNLERSFFTLVIGHVVLGLPYAVMSVKPKLEQMDPALYEAAMDLGATQNKALFKVIVPDIVPGILSAFMLSVTLSLDDYVISVFTKPGSFDTISTYVDSAMRKGGLPSQLRAFTALLFGIILLIMIAVNIKSRLDAKKNLKNLKGVN